MKKIFSSTLSLLMLFLTNCKEKEIVYTDGILDIEGMISINKNATLSELGYTSIATPLNMPENVFLPGNSYVVFSSPSDSLIFISGGNKIYVFDYEGNIKNTIGKIGHGDMEYLNIYSVSFDSNERKAYIYDGHRRIYIYSFRGEPVAVINLQSDAYIVGAYRKDDGYWAEAMTQSSDSVTISLIKFDNIGSKKASHKLISFPSKKSPDYYPVPIVRQETGFNYSYYCQYTSKMYRISNEGVKEILNIDGGEYTFKENQINDMDYRTNNRGRFVEILDIINDQNTIYLLYVLNQSPYASIIDKKSGKCLFNSRISNPVRGGGLQISDQDIARIWPQYILSDIIYSIYFNNCEMKSEINQTDYPFLIQLKKEY